MAARYHPIYDGVWDDPHLEGTSFECRAFFVFLFSCHRVRPSGIYRATDEQLVADTGLPVARVRAYLAELADRRRIVRDGAWLFVRGYFSRQPHHQNLLSAARQDVESCTSRAVLESFTEKYPLLRQWVKDICSTVEQNQINGLATVERKPSSEQSRAEQSRAEHPAHEPPPLMSDNHHPKLSPKLLDALDHCHRLGAVARLRTVAFWHAEINSNVGVHVAEELYRAEAWLASHPERTPRTPAGLVRYLHTWLARADRPHEEEP